MNPGYVYRTAGDTDIPAARTFPAVIGYGVTVATLLGVFDYTGGTLRGEGVDHSVDEFERRERLRKNYRTPGEQTLAEIGEGRGKTLVAKPGVIVLTEL